MKGGGFFPCLVDEGKHFALMFPVCGGLMICLKMYMDDDCILWGGNNPFKILNVK